MATQAALKRGFVGASKELSEFLNVSLIGQPEAVYAIVRHINKFLHGMNDRRRPLCNLMFLGPTGTGKTHVCELLAEFFFHDEKALLKVDCAEFQREHEMAKLLGAPPGYLGHRETIALFSQEIIDQYQSKPDRLFTFLLLDEIDKAHHSLLDLLLGVMDRGHFRTGDNKEIDLTRCFIIFTSNTGAREISNHFNHHLGFAPRVQEDLRKIAITALKKKVRPEFFNRLDDIVVFNSLDRDSLTGILTLELNKVGSRLQDAFQNMLDLEIEDSVKEYLLTSGTDAVYNARFLHHTIEKELVDPLLESLPGILKPNTRLRALMHGGKIVFSAIK